MALTFGTAQILKGTPGNGTVMAILPVVQDGTNTTITGLALPAALPNLQALLPATSGAPTVYSLQGPVTQPVYMNALGGTAAAGTTVTRCAPNASNPATQVDLTISAAGTSGLTINLLVVFPQSGS